MKKIYSAIALLALTVGAQAATLTADCSPAVYAGVTSSTTPVTVTLACNAFTALPAGATLIGVKFVHSRDYTEDTLGGGLPPLEGSVTYDVDAPETVFDLTGISFNRIAPNYDSGLQVVGDFTNFQVPFNVDFIVTNVGPLVTGVTFNGRFTAEYREAVPEPSTYAMLGSALLGLGLLRRRK